MTLFSNAAFVSATHHGLQHSRSGDKDDRPCGCARPGRQKCRQVHAQAPASMQPLRRQRQWWLTGCWS